MKYVRWALLSIFCGALVGCPGDPCETDKDCADDEMCTMAHTEDNPNYRKLCVTKNVQAGDRGGGWRVKEVQVGTGGVNMTVERDKE